jgi:hypothetical protein
MKGMTLPGTKGVEREDRRTGFPYGAEGPCDAIIDRPPPKADEQLAHSRYLPRMGKNSLLRALRVSVVNEGL